MTLALTWCTLLAASGPGPVNWSEGLLPHWPRSAPGPRPSYHLKVEARRPLFGHQAAAARLRQLVTAELERLGVRLRADPGAADRRLSLVVEHVRRSPGPWNQDVEGVARVHLTREAFWKDGAPLPDRGPVRFRRDGVWRRHPFDAFALPSPVHVLFASRQPLLDVRECQRHLALLSTSELRLGRDRGAADFETTDVYPLPPPTAHTRAPAGSIRCGPDGHVWIETNAHTHAMALRRSPGERPALQTVDRPGLPLFFERGREAALWAVRESGTNHFQPSLRTGEGDAECELPRPFFDAIPIPGLAALLISFVDGRTAWLESDCSLSWSTEPDELRGGAVAALDPLRRVRSLPIPTPTPDFVVWPGDADPILVPEAVTRLRRSRRNDRVYALLAARKSWKLVRVARAPRKDEAERAQHTRGRSR